MIRREKVMIIKAKERGMECGSDITNELYKLLEELKNSKEETTLVFEKGEYFISSEHALKKKLFITNTIGDNEWEKGEEPHLNTIAINIENLKDFTLNGNGCTFVLDGQMTNVVVSESENIRLENFAIRTLHPDMHEFKVVAKRKNYIDFEIDEDSRYLCLDKKYYFVGKDYCSPFDDKSASAFWIGQIRENTPNTLKRVGHPLFGAYKIKELSSHLFRAYYFLPKNYKKGDRYYSFDVRRKYAGIFVERSKNIALDSINQYFNYSLALVCQDSENIDVKNCRFAPEKGSCRKMSSVADFIQICMCRGKVKIEDNYFDGSGDDCLNVHGIHFLITDYKDKKLFVRFNHPQSHGFNPLRENDTISVVDPHSLILGDSAKILSSQSLDEYNIVLTLDKDIVAPKGYVIEDIDACPDLDFENNILTRIITRGILVTTKGKVRIIGNHFLDTSMHSILISDDAKSWYESGNVKDVLIENNYFGSCPMYNIFVKPENSVHKGYVHKNIVIKNNTFDSGKTGGMYFKSTDNITVQDNIYKAKKKIKTKNSNMIINM